MKPQESKRVTILLAGGGTGGHLYPAIALAQEFQRRRDADIVFVGTSYGIENRVLPTYPYVFKKIAIRGLQRKLSLANLLFPFRLLLSLLQCGLIVARHRPAVIIGTGGYVSGPALMVGIVFNVPTVIQEQNSYPGLVNRLLGKRVNQVHVTFKESMKYFRGQKAIYLSGNPVRGEFNTKTPQQARQVFGLAADKTTLFIFGGSQGAHAINQLMLQCLAELLRNPDLQILWAAGSHDFEETQKAVQAHAGRVSVREYIDDMPSAYAAADLAICRSGASTLSEIAICGLPAILIPLPHSAAGHQEYNARTVADAGAAVMLLEDTLSKDTLMAEIEQLLRDPDKLRAMSAAQRRLARPQAAHDIVTTAEQLFSGDRHSTAQPTE